MTQDQDVDKAFLRLVEVMDDLREKCPWDRKQTIETLRQLTIEDIITSGTTGSNSIRYLREVTSTNAARLFGLYPRKGTIAPGSDADLVVWDPDATKVVDGSTMHSAAGWSPYDGREVRGWPAVTISRGEVVAEGAQVLAEPGRGRLVLRRPFERP